MTITRLIAPRGATIGNLILDATLSEVHRKTNQLTDHPIEEGGVVTDHIQRQPEEIDIVGLVTDTPVIWMASLFALSPIADDITSPWARADLAYAELWRAMDDGDLVTVVTTLREYENMAITSLTINRDAGTGSVMPINVSLRELLKVETLEVAVPVTENEGDAAPVDGGKVVSKPDEPETTGGGTDTALRAIVGFF